jgi:hypothetical protein
VVFIASRKSEHPKPSEMIDSRWDSFTPLFLIPALEALGRFDPGNPKVQK